MNKVSERSERQQRSVFFFFLHDQRRIKQKSKHGESLRDQPSINEHEEKNLNAARGAKIDHHDTTHVASCRQLPSTGKTADNQA